MQSISTRLSFLLVMVGTSGYALAAPKATSTVPATTSTQVDTTSAIAGASVLAKQVSTQEWLGPLSAIALSPFFGLACLSGAATYGPEWLQSRSTLLGPSSPLNNPLLFWLMLGLTVATSLPRFTKVSKPLALAAEKLEMISAVIVLLAMKFLATSGSASSPDIALLIGPSSADLPLDAGIVSMPFDLALSIAAVINIVVVNTIKLSIEVLIWLIPVPTIDACLEIANKSIAASLMGLYAYSPFLSTCLNLILFALCALVFMKVQRSMRYAKDLLLMPMLERLFSMQMDPTRFNGYLITAWRGFPKNTAFRIECTSDAGTGDSMKLIQLGWLKQKVLSGRRMASDSKSGILTDQIGVRIDSDTVSFAVRKGRANASVAETSVEVA
jgi:hypothetical protein